MSLSGVREIQYNDEATYAENVTAPGSNTYNYRIPVESVDSDAPSQERRANPTVLARANDSLPGFNMPRSGEFAFTTLWGASGGSGFTNTVTESWIMDLFSDALGGSDCTATGSVVASASSGSSLTIGTSETLPVGTIVRVGAKGDGRADGQAAVVSAYNSGTGELTLLTALPGTPAGADVVYAEQIAYPKEVLTQSKRFMVGFPETGCQYHYFGCHCSGLSFTTPLDGSDMPKIGFRYQSAYWDTSAVTIPSASPALSNIEAAPIGGGSVFYNTVATATRAVLNPVQITLTLDIANAVEHSPYAGQANAQTVRQISRLRCVPRLSLVVPWDTAHRTLFASDGPDQTYKHVLVTLNAVNGRAVGFYLPRVHGPQKYPAWTDHKGLLYMTLDFIGREGPVTTNELTESAIRFFAD